MRPMDNNRRRKAAVVAGLSAGQLSPEEDLPEEAEDDLADDGAASLLSVPIRRAKVATPKASAAPHTSRDLVEYWDQLRGDRRFPSPSDVHGPAAIAAAPPGQLMICSVAGRLILVDRILSASSNAATSLRAAGTYAGKGRDPLGLDPNLTTVLDWLQQLGRKAARAGRPVEETEVFPLDEYDLIYRGLVLPLSRDQRNVDQLLCHLRTERA